MNLLLFLSDRCNMACDYCFLDLNHGAATVLEAAAAYKACDEHLKRFGKEASFTVLGGEPLIHFELANAICSRVRSASREAPIALVTNGTLACPEKLAELRKSGVSITVSLDGAARTHDSHRKVLGSRESALAESLKAFESVDKSDLRVNMVVRRDTVGALLTNVESLRAAGFSDLAFHLDVLEDWDPEGLAALAKALAGFERYRRALGTAPARFSHLESIRETPLDHHFDDVVLGADGRYYPCDGLFARPYRELDRWAVGDADSGPDWEGRERWHRNAREFIHARLPRDGHFDCARETYFHSMATGADADPRVRSFHAADEVFGGALRALARPLDEPEAAKTR